MITEGEWKVFERLDGTIAICVDKPPIYQRIATIFSNEEHNIANAQLIASAPLQNKALIFVAEWLGIRQPDGEKPNRADVVRIVNEALAKVEKKND